jgi:hypothetical protein
MIFTTVKASAEISSSAARPKATAKPSIVSPRALPSAE